MMTLISLAISVAFIFSLVVTLGYPGMPLWEELATLVTVMLLGHWIEMRSIFQAQGALKELGMERMLGATRPGGISLFRQGLLLWDLLPRMREDRLRALTTRFGELLRQHVLFTGILGVL
jgi:hypothetical protein